MTRDEFETQLARLTDEWGNVYGPERVKRLCSKFEKLDLELFSNAIDMAMETLKIPPTPKQLDEIIGALRAERQRLYAGKGATSWRNFRAGSSKDMSSKANDAIAKIFNWWESLSTDDPRGCVEFLERMIFSGEDKKHRDGLYEKTMQDSSHRTNFGKKKLRRYHDFEIKSGEIEKWKQLAEMKKIKPDFGLPENIKNLVSILKNHSTVKLRAG